MLRRRQGNGTQKVIYTTGLSSITSESSPDPAVVVTASHKKLKFEFFNDYDGTHLPFDQRRVHTATLGPKNNRFTTYEYGFAAGYRSVSPYASPQLPQPITEEERATLMSAIGAVKEKLLTSFRQPHHAMILERLASAGIHLANELPPGTRQPFSLPRRTPGASTTQR